MFTNNDKQIAASLGISLADPLQDELLQQLAVSHQRITMECAAVHVAQHREHLARLRAQRNCERWLYFAALLTALFALYVLGVVR